MCKKILYISLGLSPFVGNLAFSENFLPMKNSIPKGWKSTVRRIAKTVFANTQNDRNPAAIGRAINIEIDSTRTFHSKMANLIANNRNKLGNMILNILKEKKQMPPTPTTPPHVGQTNQPVDGQPVNGHLDLIKKGGFNLKKVDPNQPHVAQTKQPVGDQPLDQPLNQQLGHLDLIKQGGFNLKKVDPNQPHVAQTKRQPPQEPGNILQIIAQTVAAGENKANSSDESDSESSESEKSSSTAWVVKK
jgi:hypothetical protein